MDMTDDDVANLLDREFPCGSLARPDGTSGWWHAYAHVPHGSKDMVRRVSVMARTPGCLPFTTVAALDGPPADVADAAAHRSPARSSGDLPMWIGTLGNARRRVRLAREVLAGHLPRDLPDHFLDVARFVRDRTGETAALPVLTHAARHLLRHADLVEAHAAEVLPPDLLSFVTGKEDRAEEIVRMWRGLTDGGPLLRAFVAAPHAWEALLRTWLTDPIRFNELDAAGRLDDLAREALTATGLPPAIVRAARDADAALAALDGMPPDPALGTNLTYLAGKGRSHSVAPMLDALAPFPGNWVPRDAEGWRAATSTLLALSSARTVSPSKTAPEHVPKLHDVGGDWVGYRARLFRAAGVPDTSSLSGALDDVEHLYEAFRAQVVDPAFARSEGMPPNVDIQRSSRVVPRRERNQFARGFLFSGRNLVRILEASRSWHLAQAYVDDGVRNGPSGLDGNVTWRAGFPDLVRDDLELRVLTTRAELVAEGARGTAMDGVRGLSHCVGTYAPSCVSEGVRIASIRRALPGGGFERLATTELRLHGGRARLDQIRGPSNATPCGEAIDFALHYLQTLDTPGFEIDAGALTPKPRSDAIAFHAGYRWWEDGAVEAVLDLWRPLLPPRCQDVTVDQVVASLHRDRAVGFSNWWRPEPYEPAAAPSDDSVPGPP